MVCPFLAIWGSTHPLRQHAQCGENNVQLKNTCEIWKKEKGENLRGKIHGPMGRHEKGWAQVPTEDQCFVVGVGVMFGVVVGLSSWSLHPSNNEIDLGMGCNGATEIAYPSPWPCGGQWFLFVTPVVVLTGLFGWGQSMAMRVWWWGIISLAVMNSTASSDSAADAMTNLMIWAIERMAPLNHGKGSSSER
jgi:hypothetical protein